MAWEDLQGELEEMFAERRGWGLERSPCECADCKAWRAYTTAPK